MSEYIQTSHSDGVHIIRMNRPDKKNAITAAMYQSMADALKHSVSDDSIRCSLFLGTPGAFSAGNDIADFMKVAMSGKRDSMAVFDFLETIITAPKPVVAGIDGLAIGVGTTMLMHCDHVLASEHSMLKTPFVDLGLVPEAGSSLIAPRIMGHHRAHAMLVMGDSFSAKEAKEAGLVNAVTSEDSLEEMAMSVAKAYAAKPPQALKLSRDLLRGDRSDVVARMKEEAVLFGQRLESDEAKAAFMAFMAKGQKKTN